MRKKIKSRKVNPHSDDPPYEKNGSGIPMTGVSPSTIPTLIKTWKRKMDATEYP
jgi:hypothetical protein